MNIGLIRGRHEIAEVKEYVFENAIENVTDLVTMREVASKKLLNHRDEKINLYVTGLTVACATCIKICIDNDIDLSLWHYNNTTGTYFEQVINTVEKCPFCHRAYGQGWYCKNCGST